MMKLTLVLSVYVLVCCFVKFDVVTGQSSATYYFGHSLIYHTFTDYPNVSVLSVPHWMNQFHTSSWLADGTFRFANYPLPPISQWGFQPDISAWDADVAPYSASSYDSIVYTELNFVQYKPPNEPYDGDNPSGTTAVDSVVRIIDYHNDNYVNNPNIPIYLYECWNDGGSFFPGFEGVGTTIPTVAQRNDYYASSDFNSDYHQWWLDLYDAVRVERPNANVHLVPISPILMNVLRSPYLINTSFDELFEDNSPHGLPSIYFLAALILYAGMTGNRIDNNYMPVNDGTILPVIVDNFDMIVDMIYDEVLAGNFTPLPPSTPTAPTAPPPTPTAPTAPPQTPTGPTAPPPTPTNTDNDPCCDQGKGGCSTVPWCNESIENCEGECEGTWITPTTPTSPVAAPNSPPSPPPPNTDETCCDQVDDNDSAAENDKEQLTSSSIAFKRGVFNSMLGSFATSAIWILL